MISITKGESDGKLATCLALGETSGLALKRLSISPLGLIDMVSLLRDEENWFKEDLIVLGAPEILSSVSLVGPNELVLELRSTEGEKLVI